MPCLSGLSLITFLSDTTNFAISFQTLWAIFWLAMTNQSTSKATRTTAAAAAAAATAAETRAEAARARTPQGESSDTNKEEGDLDSPSAGPWRYIRARQAPRSSLWAGSQTCEHSGGGLVGVDIWQALLFVLSSEVYSFALTLRACKLACLKSLAFRKLPPSVFGVVSKAFHPNLCADTTFLLI